jgi:hypothetical protein
VNRRPAEARHERRPGDDDLPARSDVRRLLPRWDRIDAVKKGGGHGPLLDLSS